MQLEGLREELEDERVKFGCVGRGEDGLERGEEGRFESWESRGIPRGDKSNPSHQLRPTAMKEVLTEREQRWTRM